MQNSRIAWGLAAGLILSLSVGCTGNPNIVRGQNPAGAIQTAEAVTQPGYHIQQIAGSANGNSCQSCGGNGCNSCINTNLDWRPTHHHWYKYNPPKNLVYPPANQPGGVTVYPYYTHKGPDDFFLK